MARRWVGPTLGDHAAQSLAGKYAASLRELHVGCNSDPSFVIDVLGYPSPAAVAIQSPAESVSPREGFHLNSNMPHMPFENPIGHVQTGALSGYSPQEMEGQPDELSAISHILMDQQFMSMDRVISFDDNLFTASDCSNLPW